MRTSVGRARNLWFKRLTLALGHSLLLNHQQGLAPSHLLWSFYRGNSQGGNTQHLLRWAGPLGTWLWKNHLCGAATCCVGFTVTKGHPTHSFFTCCFTCCRDAVKQAAAAPSGDLPYHLSIARWMTPKLKKMFRLLKALLSCPHKQSKLHSRLYFLFALAARLFRAKYSA